VELIQAIKDRGGLVQDGDGCWVASPSLDWSTLPARVEGVVEERIERLNRELQEMLQVASIQGERFVAEIVARVEEMSERDAIWQLSRELQRRHRLVHAEGFVQLGRIRLSSYRFAHNLFQCYLYDRMSEPERVYLHRGVGQAFEELLGGQTEEAAAELARHFEEGGLTAKAAAYRLQAGERARRLSAYEEALDHLHQGLALAGEVAPGMEQTRLELDLQVSLGKVLLAMYGYGSPQVDQVFARARELVRALGDPPQAIEVVLAQSAFSLMRGQLAHARDQAEDVLRLAQAAQDERFELTSHLILGAAALYTAEYERARQHFERVMSLYDPVRHRDLAYQQGQDPGVQALAFLSRTYWLQGYPQRALDKCDQAMRLAIELDHPYSTTIATLHASTLRAWLRWWPESRAFAQEALQIAKEAGFEMRQANAAVLHGLALAHQGRTQEGISELTEGLYLWAATGAGLVVYGRTSLAEALWLAGRREEGLAAAAEALYPSEEVWWQPEQHRLHAELLLLAPGAEAEAERDLQEAADLARRQGARLLELRALTSLARLLNRQGRNVAVQERLAELSDWFDDTLDLPDLQDARQALESLPVVAEPVH
jgi:predicted ATPase